MTHYAPINESIRLGVTSDLSDETRSALAAFCRRNGFPHIYYETLDPDCLRSLVATTRGCEVLVDAIASDWQDQKRALDARSVRSAEAYFDRFGDWK